MEWYLKVLKQYVDFNGRAQRKEYWMFQLFNLLVLIALRMVGALLGGGGEGGAGEALGGLYSLAVFLPNLGVAVRRLHDIGKSGWWVLLSLVPLVGMLVLLYFFARDSEPGTNAYGPNPKAVPAP